MSTFKLGSFTRSTDDAQEISNLIRKGWVQIADPAPHDPVSEVPQEVPLWKFHQSLADAGLLEPVRALIAGLPEPLKTSMGIRFEYKDPVSRLNPELDVLGAQLGKTPADIDAIFTHAATLQ